MRLINLLIRRRNRVYSIKRFEGNPSSDDIKSINWRLKEIEREIQITSQAILEAQLVKFRSIFFKSNNLFDGFQKRIVESSVNTSVQWHQQKLMELRKEKVKLQLNLDQLTGKGWERKTLRLIRITFIVIGLLISFLFLILGIFAALYLLPIFIMLLFSFMILKTIIK